MPIEVGDQKNEIFLYRPLNLSSLFDRSAQFFYSNSLWHKRLGHPSNFVVEKLLGHSTLIKHE